ncbi:MAG: putative aspartyl protease [Cryomorphaceae bacterium]|jgi:predicted aspartyl protease
MKPIKYITMLMLGMGLSISSLSAKEVIDYRDFKNAAGKVIKAVLVDKTDTKAVFLLRNGKRSSVDISALSADDQKYVKGWNKAKAYFLTKCRGLSIGALLTLRGYEAIPVKFQGNSFIVEAKINGKPAKFIVDTGAGTSLFHTASAARTGCKLGPFEHKVYGVSGEVPAALAQVDELQIGESIFKDRQIMATDLGANMPKGYKQTDDGLFGAEMLAELDAVISYQERKLFLRPDKSDSATVKTTGDAAADADALTFRIFKSKSGKTYRGNITKKTATVITVNTQKGKKVQLPISQLSVDDKEYATKWTPDGALFLQHCRSLKIQELLELRAYQSFKYERKGNHIFVDGTLNDNKVTWMIDTGADSSLLHLGAAHKNNVDVGPMDEKVYGVGGEAPAAGCTVETISLGDAVFKKRRILATNLDRFEQGLTYAGLFGADFMRECNAVITYREQRMFMRQEK